MIYSISETIYRCIQYYGLLQLFTYRKTKFGPDEELKDGSNDIERLGGTIISGRFNQI